MRACMTRKALLASTVACVAWSSIAAEAQENEAQDGVVTSQANVPARSGSEIVVVTARRVEENLQSVPVTVTAFSSDDLEENAIVDVQRLADFTPGVTIDSFPRVAPRAWFRGVGGSNQGSGADPSTVAFLDGVNLGRGPMLGVDLFDIERVEVLKGPQGTLWGRNVIGGAINYVTARPVNDDITKFRATFGEFGQRNLNAVVNRPLGESVFARVALSSIKNDGFRTNLNDGGPLDEEERLSGRLAFAFELGETSDLLVSVDRTDDNTSGGARYNLAPNGSQDIDQPYSANPDRPGYMNRSTGGARIEYNTSALGFADFTVLVGYRDLDFSASEDFDGTTALDNAANGVAVGAVQVLMDEEAEAFSGEFRFASNSSGPISWVAGAYVLKEETTRARESETAVVDTSENIYVGDNTTNHAAVFGEATYEFVPGAHLIAGLRYTDERKEYAVTRLVGSPAAPTVDFTTAGSPGETNEQQLTWRLGADYQVTDNVFTYGTVSTGFKSGAFQERPNAATATFATEPEEAINYEVGLKSDWSDGRVRFNAAAFYMDYTNLQSIAVINDFSGPPGSTTVITDTADAEISGVELETFLSPIDGLDLNLSYAWLDAKYGVLFETLQINADGTPLINDSSGNRLTRTPENKIVFGATYETEPYSWGALRFKINGNYESDVFDDSSNNFVEYREPRTLVDASVTYLINEAASVKLWANNITNEVTRLHQSATAGGHFVQYGAPRQVGMTFDLAF